MKSLEKYISIIQKDFPYMDISSISKIGEGENSKAFIVNGKYVFRFPKIKRVKQQMLREISVLSILKPFVNLKIPEFEFISPSTDFIGYEVIHGEPLSFTIFNSLQQNNQKAIQKSLADFLFQIHNTDLAVLKDGLLETMNLKEEYSHNFRQAQKFIYPHITKSKRKKITKLFTEYLNNQQNFNYVPTLIHNDFSEDHILCNITNHQITGIIDFGDIALGDPDYDFMYLLSEFGEEFVKGVLTIYQHKNINGALKKICFFSLANKLQIILEHKDDDASEDLENAYKELELC